MNRPIAALCAAALLAGCAGGLQSAPGIPQTADAATSPHAARGKGKLLLRVTVPRKPMHAGERSTHRRAHYVSPATQSMSLAIAGPTPLTQTVNLTPNSKGCTSTLASTQCVLTLALSPGSYTATIVTYDLPGAAGNALSTAQTVPFAVVTGGTNPVNLTLSGIPTHLAVLPISATAQTNAQGGMDLFGTAASTLMVEALDADNNVILGAGSPSFSVFKNGGTLNVTLTQPVSATGNTFTVQPPALFNGNNATLEVDASFNGSSTDACAQPAAVCTAKVTVDMQESIAVANGSAVTLYPLGSSTPYATISGATTVKAIAADTSGNLYVANCAFTCVGSGTDAVLVYAPPYTGTPVAITNGVTDPLALAFDTLGNLYVANCVHSCNNNNANPDNVARYAPPFTSGSTPAASTSSGVSLPVALALDTTNDLFVANTTGNGGTGSVSEYAAAFATSAAPTQTITIGVAAPNAVALDASNNLMVSDTVANCSGASSTPTVTGYPAGNYGTNTPGTLGTTNVKCPVAIAVESGTGRLFVANAAAGGLNDVTEFNNPVSGNGALVRTISIGINGPAALLQDASRNLYVADNAGNAATIYTRSLGFQLQQTLSGVSGPTALAILP